MPNSLSREILNSRTSINGILQNWKINDLYPKTDEKLPVSRVDESSIQQSRWPKRNSITRYRRPFSKNRNP